MRIRGGACPVSTFRLFAENRQQRGLAGASLTVDGRGRERCGSTYKDDSPRPRDPDTRQPGNPPTSYNPTPMPRVTFVDQGKAAEFPAGRTILSCAGEMGVRVS